MREFSGVGKEWVGTTGEAPEWGTRSGSGENQTLFCGRTKSTKIESTVEEVPGKGLEFLLRGLGG